MELQPSRGTEQQSLSAVRGWSVLNLSIFKCLRVVISLIWYQLCVSAQTTEAHCYQKKKRLMNTSIKNANGEVK